MKTAICTAEGGETHREWQGTEVCRIAGGNIKWWYSKVACCHYPWEDRCGPLWRLSFTGSHLETVLDPSTRDRTFASIHGRVQKWGHTLRCMLSLTGRVQHPDEDAAGEKIRKLCCDAAVKFQATGTLKTNHEYNIISVHFRFSCSSSVSNTETTPAKALSQSVLTTVLVHPKSFPFFSELQGNKETWKKKGGGERGRV